MRPSGLLLGVILPGISAHPYRPNLSTSNAVSTAASASAGSNGIHKRSIEGSEAEAGDMIYEETESQYKFELGHDLVDKLNEVAESSCTESEDDCYDAVDELISALPETGNLLERSNDTSSEPRQLVSLGGAAAVLAIAHVLHIASHDESQPQPLKVSLLDDLDDSEKGPIEISLDKDAFPGSITGTETETTDTLPEEKYVLFATSIADSEKQVSAVSSAIEAIVTGESIVPSVSDYSLRLPGWFKVNATRDQQLEIALIPHVEHIVGGLELRRPDDLQANLDSDEDDGEDEGDRSSVRRSESSEHSRGLPLARRDGSRRDLPIDADNDHGECLRFASWADGMQDPPQYYLYQENEGKDYPIYSLEESFDLSHEEFSDDIRAHYSDHPALKQGEEVSADLTWFNGEFEEFDSKTSLEDADTFEPHGTSMAAMLMGQTVGLLPQSRPILVRLATNGPGMETTLRNVASHIKQRHIEGEKRSPIIALATAPGMADIEGNDYQEENCIWAERFAGDLQKLVDLGATIVIAAGQYRLSDTDQSLDMTVVIALGLGQPCKDKWNIDVPHVEGMEVISAVDTATRRKWKGVSQPYENPGIELRGPWVCPGVDYDGAKKEFVVDNVGGTSIATYWTAGILADIAYQMEDDGELPDSDTPDHRSQELRQAAKDLQWTRPAPMMGSEPKALWNGLRDPEGRDEESDSTSTAASAAPTSSAPSTSSTSVPEPEPTQDWASGWCGVHVRQKLYNDKASSMTLTIYDADQVDITADGYDEEGPNLDYGNTYDTPSKLPASITVSAEGPDSPIDFDYDGQTWSSDDTSRCSVGKWDSGAVGATMSRAMDCGFSC